MELSLNSSWLSIEARHKTLERWLAALSFTWPFAFLSPYLVAVPGWGRQTGNDFDIIYYRYKTYLLDVLASEGRFPMWSPSEAAGYPFFASPFTASAYPLNIPHAGIYRVLEGYSHQDHQIYSILAIAIFSLGLRHDRTLGLVTLQPPGVGRGLRAPTFFAAHASTPSPVSAGPTAPGPGIVTES